MEQWLHCNKCFRLYSIDQRNFFSSPCSHILCSNCIEPKCPICGGNYYYSLIQPNSIQLFFDFQDLQPIGKQLLNAAKFQFKQRLYLEHEEVKILDEIEKVRKKHLHFLELEENLRTGIRTHLHKIESSQYELYKIKQSARKTNQSKRRRD